MASPFLLNLLHLKLPKYETVCVNVFIFLLLASVEKVLSIETEISKSQYSYTSITTNRLFIFILCLS